MSVVEAGFLNGRRYLLDLFGRLQDSPPLPSSPIATLHLLRALRDVHLFYIFRERGLDTMAQIGLKLEASKQTVPVIVIDSAERPSEN